MGNTWTRVKPPCMKPSSPLTKILSNPSMILGVYTMAHMGSCQNYGPLLGPYDTTAPRAFRGPQRGPKRAEPGHDGDARGGGPGQALVVVTVISNTDRK